MNGLKNTLTKPLRQHLSSGLILHKDGNNTLNGLKCGKCQNQFVFPTYSILCPS